MKNNKRIFKNSLLLFVRLIVTSLIGLVSSRIILQSLGASDFGLYNIVGGIVVMMAFLNTVMISTTFRFIAYEYGRRNIQGVKKVFNISLVIHLILAIIVLLFSFTIGEFYVKNHLNIITAKIPDALFVLRFSVLATVFTIISVPYQGLITAKENFLVRIIIEICRSLLILATAIIILYYLGNQLRLYAILNAFVMFVPAFLFFLYCKKIYSNIVSWSLQKDINKYKEMIGFSGWIMIGAGTSVGKIQGAALIINTFFGTILNASFGVASQVNSLVLMFSSSIGQAAIPQITKSFSGGDEDRSINLVSYVSKYTFFLMLIPALPILLETDFLLEIWLGEVPVYTAIFCQLIIINTLVDCLGAGIPALVQATGKIKYFQLVLSTTSLMSLPIAYILFKNGGEPYTILLVFIITAMINVVIRQVLLKKIINFNVGEFIKKSYLKVFLVSILVLPLFLIPLLLKSSFSRFILVSVISVLWTLTGIYLVGIDKNEKRHVHNGIKRGINFQNRTK